MRGGLWATPRKGQRRMWEVKTGTGPDAVPREHVNQLLGQVRVEQDKHPKARVVGCLLTDLTEVENDAADAAQSEIVLVHLDAAEALFDQMSERFTAYQSAYGSGTAEERGAARAAVEQRLPTGDWLVRLLSPSGGQLVRRADVLNVLRGA
jgi:hypothetical protein